MAEIVTDCPRCGAKHTTSDVLGSKIIQEIGWVIYAEAYSVCRQCNKGTIFRLRTIDPNFSSPDRMSKLAGVGGSLTGNKWVTIEGHVSVKDAEAMQPPEHLPANIQAVFNEGALCFAVGCNNAAGTMFRLCVDLATKALLPDPADEKRVQPNGKQRRDLGLRLPWLFEQNLLQEALHDLSSCIKEDGNDGAHAGTLTKVDVEDILDFTTVLLERLYTEPVQIQKAKDRRAERRSQA